jgi:hypothetical protein
LFTASTDDSDSTTWIGSPVAAQIRASDPRYSGSSDAGMPPSPDIQQPAGSRWNQAGHLPPDADRHRSSL